MKIRTTVNIRYDLLKKLESASITLNMSKTAIISALIKHLMDNNSMKITA